MIKYPSSWENALASAGLGNGFIPVLPQGGRNRVYRYSRAGAHPRVASLGLCPIYLLQGHPHPPQCAHWGTFPLEGGRLGGKSDVQPLRRIQKPSLLFVGAGHRPARRCTRRAESWFRPVSLALAGQFTFSRPTGCRDLHGRPHGAPTEGGRKFPKRAADSRPYKENRKLIPNPSRATARAAPTAYPAPGALVRETQAQFLNRTSGIFCTPRAQWPGGNPDRPLRFCAPEKMHGLSGGRPP